MNINNLDSDCFLNRQQYHRRPYHLRSLILNFDDISTVENCIVYNYEYNKRFIFDKRQTSYFIEISYLTLDKKFVESEKLKTYLIEILKKQILLNKRNDLTLLKIEISVEKLHKKLKKLKLL